MSWTSAELRGVPEVERLELEALPPGQVTRLLVTLAHDGLGRPTSVPVLVARGARPGPVFGLTAAVHGNELNGIPVIHRLVQRLDMKHLRGTVVAVVVVNLPGYHGHERKFSDGADLNHLFPGVPDGNAGQVWAHRLLDRVVGRFDYLVDLHTASFGRVNSLYVRADMSQPETAQMARLQRPQIILHNPASDHTLRGAAEELGIHSITVEIGDPQRFQPEYIRRSLAGIRAVMAEHGMIRRRKPSEAPPPVVCSDSDWLHTDCGGLLEVFPNVTDVLEPGDAIARLHSVFGDVLREYRAPRAGVVIGKSTNPVAQTGSRIIHLGVVGAAPGSAPVSPPRAERDPD